MEAIHSKESPPDKYLLKVLIKFLQQAEPRPTWRVIVDALRSRSVNLPALASKVEATHYPVSPSSARGAVPESMGKWLSSPLKADWCSYYVSITSDTESAIATGDDDEVTSKPSSQQPNPVPGETITVYIIPSHYIINPLLYR